MHFMLYMLVGIVIMNAYIFFSSKNGTSYTYNEFFLLNLGSMFIWPVMIISIVISKYGDKTFIKGDDENDRK